VRLQIAAGRRLVEEADVLVVVGSELGQGDHGSTLAPAGRVVRIDVDPVQAHGNVAADVAVVGDAGATLAALLERLPAAAPEAPEAWSARRADLDREAAELGRPWAAVAAALEAALAPGDVLAVDNAMVGYNGVVGSTRLGAGSRLLFPTGFGTLGYALPAAIGAKLARPDRRVAAVLGDGGVMFTVQELATAAALGVPLPVVVSLNDGYGEIRREMQELGFAPLGVDLGACDLPAVARAMGGHGVALADAGALPEALDAAFERAGPTLITVPE
jgi:acetolactate synthase-1/2/3 large subunit